MSIKTYIEQRKAQENAVEIYQSSLKLEQNPALVYQGTPQRGDADISARKKLYWNPKDSGIAAKGRDFEQVLRRKIGAVEKI